MYKRAYNIILITHVAKSLGQMDLVLKTFMSDITTVVQLHLANPSFKLAKHILQYNMLGCAK